MGSELGEQIVKARAGRRKTLRGLAAEVGVSPALLSLVEQGKHEPQRELIVTLATVLGEDADAWCALVGRVRPDVESELARVARDDPAGFRSFLRTMPDRARRPCRDPEAESGGGRRRPTA